MATTVGKNVNRLSLIRGLEAQERAGTIRRHSAFPGNKWLVRTSTGEDFVLVGLAQVHAFLLGLRSAEQARENAYQLAMSMTHNFEADIDGQSCLHCKLPEQNWRHE